MTKPKTNVDKNPDAVDLGSEEVNNLVPDSVKGTGYFTPMDIAPGEFESKEAPVTPSAETTLQKSLKVGDNSADDELRKKIYHISLTPINDIYYVPPGVSGSVGLSDKKIDEIIAAINRLYVPRSAVVKAIGEDDELECDCGSDSCGDYMGSACKNNLRAEIRERLGLDK
jgi:hypothetical protein